MKYITVALVVVLGIGIFSVGFFTKKDASGHSEPLQTNKDLMVQGLPSFTLKEIANHNSINDCWMVIHGKVYDFTDFIFGHPGGATILEGCGKDATTLYETRPMGSGTSHSERAREIAANFVIGTLAQ